jgi:YD repeat-containing protein
MDQLGRKTEWVYDSLHRPVAMFNPDGSTSRIQYNDNGLVTARSDEMGQMTRYTYDAMGRTLTTTDALGNSAINTYDVRWAPRLNSPTIC